MADPTAIDRVRRQRELRVAQGWQEVKVWVPTKRDAADIRKLAEERRARVEALEALPKEVPTVSVETAARIAKAIAQHGLKAYTTPSGAVLTLMSQLAEEDDLASFSQAYVHLARAHPRNAAFVAAAVPAKISNHLILRRGVDPAALIRWTISHPDWTERLQSAVRDPASLEHTVSAMIKDIDSQPPVPTKKRRSTIL